MNRPPLGFKYILIALFLSLAFGTYFLFIQYGSQNKCVLDYSEVKFGRVINNKEGKTHRLTPIHSGPINYAYRKLARQSRTYAGDGVYGSFRAVDGYYEDGTMSHTEDTEEAFLDVDLGREIAIRSVRVWNRKDEYGVRMVPFYILISNAPYKDMNLHDAKSISIASKFITQTEELFLWNLDEAIKGRYVRVQIDHKNFLHFNELEVFDVPMSTEKISRPNYESEIVTPPIIQLPSTFPSFLQVAGHALNISNPKRLFTHTGMELKAETFDDALNQGGTDYYISQGEGFAGDVRVCIVFLCTDGTGYNTNADYLSEIFSNLEVLSANVFHMHKFTIIIFYSWTESNILPNKERFARTFPYLNIKFADVSRHFPPHLPQHLIDNKVDMSWFEKGTDCAPGNNWKLNYLHMGRFWSTKLWYEPILKDYDLIWRLDADATVDAPMHDNFLRDMWSKKKLFAYWCRFHDTAECDTGISEATDEFAKKKGLVFKHRHRIDTDAAYWGGFGVYATKFFCYDKDWLEYADYLDSLGGHYNHRWGEQNVFPYALGLFLDFEQLYWVKTSHLQIFHDHHPAESCLGVDSLLENLVTKK